MTLTLKDKIVGVVANFALIWIVYQGIRYTKLKKKYDIQSVDLMNKNDSATVYKTKSGELYSQLQSVTIDKNALKASLAESGFEIKKLRARDVKWRNIVSALKIKLVSAGRIDTIRLHDTTYIAANGVKLIGKTYNWTNNYLTLSGLIRDKSMDVNYSYSTQLYYTNEQVGHQSKITIWSSDPNARITTGSQITVSAKSKWYEKWWLHELVGIGIGRFLFK